MDQLSNNVKLIDNHLADVFKDLESNQVSNKLFSYLCEDYSNPFISLMYILKDQNMSASAKLMFVLMLYMNGREPTDYLADVLSGPPFGRSDIAIKLKEFNRSEPPKPYSDPNALLVQKAITRNTGTSQCYIMDQNPRGVCIIILNEEDLRNEANAFSDVFTQLYFKVEIWSKQTAQQIRKIFSDTANNQNYKNMNALITVYIGHGQNDCILGTNFADPNPNIRDNEDRVPIADLVNTFSDNKCQVFKDKPKINLFICCRHRAITLEQNLRELQKFNLSECLGQYWHNSNAHTTVIFSSAEGLKSYYDEKTGFSLFGKAFIHTIAQYAHENDFDKLLNRVYQRLEADGNADQKPQVVKHFCPYLIYFNPGLQKNK